jgi:hypothetical protein
MAPVPAINHSEAARKLTDSELMSGHGSLAKDLATCKMLHVGNQRNARAAAG